MDIKVKASTKIDYQVSKEELEKLSGNAAGVCYMPHDFDTLNLELEEKTLKRANMTKVGGHHSVFGHGFITLQISGVPKLFAMLLNNEKIYNTSEKSARYTHMNLSGIEKELYDKWHKKIFEIIDQKYGQVPYFDQKRIDKLSMEIARYFTSVMTPTSFEYTVSYQQLNYMCNWMKKFGEKDNVIYKMLKPTADEFLNQISDLGYLDDELNDRKNRFFSLVGDRVRAEEFGENYSTNYLGSFAYLAQAQRHRTLNYEMNLLVDKKFVVPEILKSQDYSLVDEWINDMKKVIDLHPQGELININERGTYENLILKAQERLCTAAQLEIMKITNEQMQKYIKNTNNEFVKNELKKYTGKARCASGYPCKTPCGFKAGIDLTRDI